MKVISHSQEGFLALYVIALREVGHERESSRSSADRAKARQIIQLLLCGNFVNLQCSSFLSPSLSLFDFQSTLFCQTCNISAIFFVWKHGH